MSRDSKMCAAQFAKGMGIGLGVGMAVGAAAGLMMQPQKKRANGIVASAHLTLGMVRTLKAQGVKTLVFTTLLSRSTTVSVDALLAAEPDAPDEMAVVWTHTGPRAALTIGGADHSDLLK